STSAKTSAATPALMWTTVPPAKSSGYQSSLKMGPASLRMPPPQTQNATGEYTKMLHSAAKVTQAANFMRSATAPEISAVVMMANVAPKPAHRVSGTPSLMAPVSIDAFKKKSSAGFPNKPPATDSPAPPMELPTAIHVTATIASEEKLIIIMFNTDFERD